MAFTPTIRGRRLAGEIRRLRESRSMTCTDAAAMLGWDQGKLSRVERAQMRVTVGEVMEICEAFAISGQQRGDLVQLARDARKQGWWHTYRGVLKQGFSDYLAFEAEATVYSSYETHLIPGLLQSEAYARAVLRGSGDLRAAAELDRAVEARRARQERVTDAEPLQVFQIIEEGALHRVVGDQDTMHGQLQHLDELGRLPNVSIQIVPYRAATHVALDGPFTLLQFDDYPSVLYVEHFMGCQYYEKSEETAHGSVVFNHLRSSALNTSDSAALIRNIAAQHSGGN